MIVIQISRHPRDASIIVSCPLEGYCFQISMSYPVHFAYLYYVYNSYVCRCSGYWYCFVQQCNYTFLHVEVVTIAIHM